ncbi:MAG: hypothetical protein QXU96_04895 [Ignisphaera sp.]
MKEVVVVYRDGSVEKIPMDRILSRLKRENGYIVVEPRDVFDSENPYVFLGLIDVDLENGEFINTFKRYMEAQKPRLYSKCEVVGSGTDYFIVQRYDGTLFKINNIFLGKVLLDIVDNSVYRSGSNITRSNDNG